MLEINLLLTDIKDMQVRTTALIGVFDYVDKQERLQEVERELAAPDIWDEPEKARALTQERSNLLTLTGTLDSLQQGLADSNELLILASAEADEDALQSLTDDLANYRHQLQDLEFQRMFSGQHDSHDAYLEIQAGSGGTEAQDWAEMLLRMYLRWGEQRAYSTELVAVSPGEVAGIKHATIFYRGAYAFGWLRTETGVHRLVRKSPFDSGNRRHTSFASVFVSADIDDDIDIVINPADLMIDTYRASGAGGQHVNKTDSAVRLTHKPSGVVVQCQNDRSQHKNKSQAMKQLRAKLYELEMQKQNADKKMQEENKAEIGWGSQIRSYVLDQSRIKDLRTEHESSNPQSVLDGNLDDFIKASLQAGL